LISVLSADGGSVVLGLTGIIRLGPLIIQTTLISPRQPYWFCVYGIQWSEL